MLYISFVCVYIAGLHCVCDCVYSVYIAPTSRETFIQVEVALYTSSISQCSVKEQLPYTAKPKCVILLHEEFSVTNSIMPMQSKCHSGCCTTKDSRMYQSTY